MAITRPYKTRKELTEKRDIFKREQAYFTVLMSSKQNRNILFMGAEIWIAGISP